MDRAIAFITPSYAGDFERCRLLCESLDLAARDRHHHYILVADHDLALFRPLAGSGRSIIPESEILPRWLKAMRRPFGGGRMMWTSLSPLVWPMSGWHTQQLRKMMIARHISEDVLVMADSDSLFVRPFDNSTFVRDEAVRLYVRERAIDAAKIHRKHRIWVRNASALFGLPVPPPPEDEYISNLVSWRRDNVLGMLDTIEARAGCDVVAALGKFRTFSEYQIYGAYVTGVLHDKGHYRTNRPLSHTYWFGEAMTPKTLAQFAEGIHQDQIAIGVQSFTGTSTDVLRDYLRTLGNAR